MARAGGENRWMGMIVRDGSPDAILDGTNNSGAVGRRSTLVLVQYLVLRTGKGKGKGEGVHGDPTGIGLLSFSSDTDRLVAGGCGWLARLDVGRSTRKLASTE